MTNPCARFRPNEPSCLRPPHPLQPRVELILDLPLLSTEQRKASDTDARLKDSADHEAKSYSNLKHLQDHVDHEVPVYEYIQTNDKSAPECLSTSKGQSQRWVGSVTHLLPSTHHFQESGRQQWSYSQRTGAPQPLRNNR